VQYSFVIPGYLFGSASSSFFAVMAFPSKRASAVALLWLLAGVVVVLSAMKQFTSIGRSAQRNPYMSAVQGQTKTKTITNAWNNGWNNGYQQSRYPLAKQGEVNPAGAVVGSASAMGLFAAVICISSAPVALIGVAAVALAAATAGRDGRFQKPIKDFVEGVQNGSWRPKAGNSRRW